MTTTSSIPRTKVPVKTTITTSSTTCVVNLQGQVLYDGKTGLITNAGGGYVTLNQTCFHPTTSQETTTHRANVKTVVKTVYSSPTNGSGAHHHHRVLSTGEIAGIALAIVSVLAVILSVVGLLWCRRRRQRRMIEITMPRKNLDDDPSDEISIRWETDGSEIKEMSSNNDPVEKSSTKPRSMDVSDASLEPVEMGDGRSIRIADDSPTEEDIVNPFEEDNVNPFEEDIVSPVEEIIVSPL